MITMKDVPINDNFSGAIELDNTLDALGTINGGEGIMVQTNNYGASYDLESGEPDHKISGASDDTIMSIWYKFQAPSNGICIIEIFESIDNEYIADTPDNEWLRFAVYRGSSVDNLTLIEAASGAESSVKKHIVFDTSLGEFYYIAFSSLKETFLNKKQAGKIPFRLLFSRDHPINDRFENAIDLGRSTFSEINGHNIGSSFDKASPVLFGAGIPEFPFYQGSVWYKWQPPVNGSYRVYLSTRDANFGFDVFVTINPPNVSELMSVTNGFGETIKFNNINSDFIALTGAKSDIVYYIVISVLTNLSYNQAQRYFGGTFTLTIQKQ